MSGPKTDHPPHEAGREPVPDEPVRPRPAAHVHDLLLLPPSAAEDALRRRRDAVEDRVVEVSGRGAADRAGPRGRDGSLLDAGQVRRAVHGALLLVPGEDFGSRDVAVRGAVLGAQVDVAELQLDDVDVVVVVEELELAAEGGREA